VTFAPGGFCTLTSGSCSVIITPSTTGTIIVSATYNGDSSHKTSNGSTSVKVNQPSKYALSWQGFDWDGGGEQTLTMNGKFLASLPSADIPANGGAYAAFSVNVTLFVVQGTNTLVFTHANWDCSVVDSVRNLQLTNGPTVVYSNSTVEPLSCAQSLTYVFTIGGSSTTTISVTYSSLPVVVGQSPIVAPSLWILSTLRGIVRRLCGARLPSLSIGSRIRLRGKSTSRDSHSINCQSV
jgi:hypothetical protein